MNTKFEDVFSLLEYTSFLNILTNAILKFAIKKEPETTVPTLNLIYAF